MESITAFLAAALPWLVMGAVLAVFFVREAKRKKGKKEHQKNKDDYGSEGMTVGMCLGAAIATALHRDIGLGLSLGCCSVWLSVPPWRKRTKTNKADR